LRARFRIAEMDARIERERRGIARERENGPALLGRTFGPSGAPQPEDLGRGNALSDERVEPLREGLARELRERLDDRVRTEDLAPRRDLLRRQVERMNDADRSREIDL